ncbi:protein of unknown function DUF323 [Methanosalsum zhilinae DSM 4017]|uniref:Sulfatase-modifying factor enzyme-like domain-containing protein n=1 Tax=Methanosalsum zhilinae (strain DSM 4017 / NBRC 107636 / OCM 62 / WeN5) TaxID=679901 RepID=F7XNI9_METZD|nr:formylglycine-generating enzyme family protein [Methanosalsum zhilinae]AEH60086.1 protein of unknown function DUF323 [Methanosalsum zhilinae DSM 4017]
MGTNKTKVHVNSIGMELVKISPGRFLMGSEFEVDESPVHEKTIPHPFYLGRYPVTQIQWSELMHDNPAYFKGATNPVDQVSWYDVQEFVERLNSAEGTDKYSLPSEAEWEYACRAGSNTRFSFGDDEKLLGEYCWYDSNSYSKSQPVGRKRSNDWGLYDMHGNLWEWCQDRWHDTYNGAPMYNEPWSEGHSEGRVIRGGCWHSFPDYCRSSKRYCIEPGERHYSLGFRILRRV